MKDISSAPEKKIAYSCFVDAKEKFEKEALRWVWSLLEKINVSPGDIYITCDRNVSRRFTDTLKLVSGLNLFFDDRFTTTSPPANKWLQMKYLPLEDKGYSHVVISDCDKVFLSFSKYWCDDSVRACKFVPRPTFSVFESLFNRYFDEVPRFELEKPDPRDASRDTRGYVNNHNGGLIILPIHKVDSIRTLWKHWIDELMSNPEILQENVRNLDQVALALTMHSMGCDINFLPKTLDIGPNISDISPYLMNRESGQLVLHIHGSDDDEGRIICGDANPDSYREMVVRLNNEYMTWKSARPQMRMTG